MTIWQGLRSLMKRTDAQMAEVARFADVHIWPAGLQAESDGASLFADPDLQCHISAIQAQEPSSVVQYCRIAESIFLCILQLPTAPLASPNQDGERLAEI